MLLQFPSYNISVASKLMYKVVAVASNMWESDMAKINRKTDQLKILPMWRSFSGFQVPMDKSAYV